MENEFVEYHIKGSIFDAAVAKSTVEIVVDALSISYMIFKRDEGIKLSPVIRTAHSASTVSSIQTTGSAETLLLIKLELHFEGFSFNLVPRVLSYPHSFAS